MKRLTFLSLLLGLACIVAIIAAYLSEQMGLTIISNFFSIGAIVTGIGSIVVDSKPFKS
jgi:NhaP-type Na+/H+ and K+/H+ antiporter